MIRIALSAAIAICALAGCSTYDLPKTAEAGLNSSQGIVHVSALSCRPDGSVVATGYGLSGFSSHGGLILRSTDRGLNWEVVRDEGSMSDASTWFFEDPRDSEKVPRPLYVTGHRNLGLAAVASMSYALASWLESLDDGRSWNPSPPLAPFGSSTKLVEPDSQRILLVDQAGALAFTRVQRGLNPWKDWSVMLMRSRDGRAWAESVVPGLTHDPHALLTDGKGRLLVVGRRGEPSKAELVILQSDDGGDHWTESLRHEGGGWWWGVAGSADGEVIVWSKGARGGRAYFSSGDGGRTWAGRSIALWQPFRHVVNVGPGHWVALSVESAGSEQEAIAWSSADGGLTWSAHRTGLRRKQSYEAMGYDSTLVSLGNGVLIAHAGGSRVARSSDGGRTWQLHDAGLPNRDFGLRTHCADSKGLVVLAGDYGLLTRSLDFGLTWRTGRMAGQSP